MQLFCLLGFVQNPWKWVDPKFKHSFSDEMSYPIESLEDNNLDTQASESIGWVLRHEKEARVCEQLASCLFSCVEEIGTSKPDSTYINSPLWQDVVQKAKEAYDVLMEDEDLGELCYQEEIRIPPTLKEGVCSLQGAYFALYYFIESRNHSLWNSVYFALEEALWVQSGETLEEKPAWKLWLDTLRKKEIHVFHHKEQLDKWDKIKIYNGYLGMFYFIQTLVRQSPNSFLEKLCDQVEQGLKEMESASSIEESTPWKEWTQACLRAREKEVKEMCLEHFSPTIFFLTREKPKRKYDVLEKEDPDNISNSNISIK